ncbi:MAG TPA: metallophosphoesterase [Candidatus Acidoferrum sp.]|nr:metallophosphoesterase [Candidatus Acidoferrum sp.]
MNSLKQIGSEPALLLRRGKEKIIVVGDLHIGWEVTLSRQGIHVPSQTFKMLSRLREIIQNEKPTRVIMLGDVKHSVSGAELEEWRDVPEFFEELAKLVPCIQVVLGNHDGNLEPLTPSSVQLIPSTGIELWKKFGLIHGHAWPAPELLECETLILGHLHPAITLRDAMGYRLTKPVWIIAPCDVRKLIPGVLKAANVAVKSGNPQQILNERFHIKPAVRRCVFIPPFNDFLGGRPVNSKRIEETHAGEGLGPIVRSRAVDLENAEIHLLDGTYLGHVRELRAFG